MCLILFANDIHPEYRLILAANRDEFHDRPTAAAGPWHDHPNIVGGRDLLAGGTWLAVTPEGRWGAVTNYRDAVRPRSGSTSRGRLVVDYLAGTLSPTEYAETLRPRLNDFEGFNLLVGDEATVVYLTNRPDEDEARDADDPSETPAGRLEAVTPGIHGLSNHLLDTPWPKVERGRLELEVLLQRSDSPAPDTLLSILLDRTYAADHDLPSAGTQLDLERALSARFIVTPEFGTRSSTALLIGRDGGVVMAERRYDAAGEVVGEGRWEG